MQLCSTHTWASLDSSTEGMVSEIGLSYIFGENISPACEDVVARVSVARRDVSVEPSKCPVAVIGHVKRAPVACKVGGNLGYQRSIQSDWVVFPRH